MSQSFERTEAHISAASKLKTAGRFLATTARHPEGAITLLTGWGNAPIGCSIDVTPNCPLRCSHCYLYGKEYQQEGVEDDDEFMEKVGQFLEQYPSARTHLTAVGGEPMSRQKRLRRLNAMFNSSWNVTNGIFPIKGEWPEGATFFISIDGLEKTHNDIRQLWKRNPTTGLGGLGALPVLDQVSVANDLNVYQTAKRTANEATAPVYLHTVVNQKNIGEIPELVGEWHDETQARGMAFSLHTPQVNPDRESGMTESDEQLFLGEGQRREFVAMMHGLKDQWGDFLLMNHRSIDYFLPENQLKVFGQNCQVVKSVHSLDSTFQKKEPCVMGEGMDCNKCGCVIPVDLFGAAHFNPGTMRSLIGTIPR